MKFKMPHLEVVAKAETPSEVDLLMYGVIGDWWDSEDENPLTDIAFAKTFRALERNYDRINIHINSPGGSISAGLAIYNTIKYSTKDVHTYIDGIAASMAAVIALAGKTVHSAKNGIFMLHNGSGLAWGNAETMREMAGVLDTFDKAIIMSVAAKTGNSEKEVKDKWFDYKDHFMTAEEAADAKLVDVVEDYVAEDMPDAKGKTAKDLFDHFSEKDNTMNLKDTWNAIKAFFTGEEITDEGLEKVNAELERLNGELVAKEEILKQVQDDMAAKDEILKQVQDDMAAKEEILKQVQDDVVAKDTKITELEAKLASRPGADIPNTEQDNDEIRDKDDNSLEARIERAKAL